MHPEIPALSFLSAALALAPLVWYFHARNIAAVTIGIWLSVVNLIYAIDALIWAGDTDVEALVWCDISTSVITGSRIAVPAACLCICIHLERLASFCQTSTPQAKRRRIVFECVMCFVLPLVYVALHLIVQPRRFDLLYGFGCRPATYPAIATIFLVVIPPLLLTVATVIYAGAAWRHFLVHGVQFYGRRGSTSSLTRNRYLRLVGMAVLEAVLSAVLVAVVMSGVLSPGLTPLENMSRNLSEVLVWDSEATTNNVRTILEIEWSLIVVQSVVFFALFACQMEVVCEGWGLIRSFLRLLRTPNQIAMLWQDTLEQPSTSNSVSTLPITEVDLSLIIQSATTLTPYARSMDKPLPPTPSPSHPLSVAKDAPENVVISAVLPAMIPLEPPSRDSAIASSHNSLESNFDPSQFVLPLEAWPRTPMSIPTRLPCRSISVGYHEQTGESHFDADMSFPQAKHAAHIRSCTVELFR